MAIDKLYVFASSGTTAPLTQAQQEAGFSGQVYYGYWNYMQRIYSEKMNELVDAANANQVFEVDSSWHDGSELQSETFSDAINEIVGTLAYYAAGEKISGIRFTPPYAYVDMSNGTSLSTQLQSLAKVAEEARRGDLSGRPDGLTRDQANGLTGQNTRESYSIAMPWDKGNTLDLGVDGNKIGDMQPVNLIHPDMLGKQTIGVLYNNNAVSALPGTKIIDFVKDTKTLNGTLEEALISYDRSAFEAARAELAGATPQAFCSAGQTLYVLWWFNNVDPGDEKYKRMYIDAYEFNQFTGNLVLRDGYVPQLLLPTGGGDPFTSPRIHPLHLSSGIKLCVVNTMIDHGGSPTQPAILTLVDPITGNLLDSGCGNMAAAASTSSFATGCIAINETYDVIYFAAKRDGLAMVYSAKLSDLEATPTLTTWTTIYFPARASTKSFVSLLICEGETLYAMQSNNSYPESQKNYLEVRSLDEPNTVSNDRTMDLSSIFQRAPTVGIAATSVEGGFSDGQNLWIVFSERDQGSNAATFVTKLPYSKLSFRIDYGNPHADAGVFVVEVFSGTHALQKRKAFASFPGVADRFRYPMCFDGSDLYFINSDENDNSNNLTDLLGRLPRLNKK